jgi:hypothetical protein
MKQRINIKKIGSCIAGLGLLLMTFACNEEKIGQNPIDSTPPPPITNTQAEPIPGGARITYEVPDITDISYVKCEYMFKGEKKIVRSSIYLNYLYIQGLAAAEPCEYTLYLVDHSENISTPVTGTFTPLEPPYQTIFRTIEMEPDFGGVIIRWKNETNAMIGAFLLVLDENNEWFEYDLAFSTLSEDKRSIRGYPVEERVFGVTLLDQYGNVSDTFRMNAIPLYEKELDKKKFRNVLLQGDNNSVNNNRPIENIWDGSVSSIWHTNAAGGFTPPQYFTINLGVDAQLSRLIVWNRPDGFIFSQHNLRYFEVWGTNELKEPNSSDYWPSGNWRDDWILLGDFEEIKPSGLPDGQSNADDQAATEAGCEFIFEPGAGMIHYLRFVVKETWQRTAAMHIGEITVFGDDGERDE